MNMSSLCELASVIDNTCDNGDINELNTIISYHGDFTETLEDSIEKVYSYYLLGNAWSGVREIKHSSDDEDIWSLTQEEVFQEIYFYRKAKVQKSFKDLNLELKIAINVNLANAFSHYGRTINAIKYFNYAIGLKNFDKKIELHPNFILAKFNKAKALDYYAKLDYDHSHTFIFIQFAYKNFKESKILLNTYLELYEDDGYYESVKNEAQKYIDYYEKQSDIKNLENLESFENYEPKYSKNEQHYRDWCLQNRLFLNPMNDLGNYKIASHDPLNLPNLTTSINEGFPKFITYFNQMKQEYISYRHILFEGLNKKTQKFYDKEASITDDYDYNMYDTNTEKIKLAFRGFYSIFDKIAYFMNEYFQIGLNENNVDFKKIWYDYEKDRRTVRGIKSIFNKSENLALRGIYLISKDLFFSDENSKDFLDALEPEAEKLNKIRNHLEHKFISIKILNIESFETVSDRKRNFYITDSDLEAKTLHLAQLAREAMIYLSFAVHIFEENKKDSEGLYVPILMNTLNDNRR
jgi:hypothetical protein